MLEEFTARGARMRGLRVRPSRFRGHTDALWVGPRQIAHCHNGQVDARLTRAVVRELRDELRSDAPIARRAAVADVRAPGALGRCRSYRRAARIA